MHVNSFIPDILATITHMWDGAHTAYSIIAGILIALMFVAAVAAIILVMLIPGNSQGIDALGGSSETFYGKNKGQSRESKLKKWTVVCFVLIAVLAITFYIVSIPSLWGLAS